MSSINEALYGRDLFGDVITPRPVNRMSEVFTVPPFSVLNAREGWWQSRKAAWIRLGIQSELGRGENALGLSPECEAYRLGEGDYSKCGAVQPTGSGLAAGQEARRQEEKVTRGATAIPGGGTGRNSAWKFQTSDGYRSLKELGEAEGAAVNQQHFGTRNMAFDGGPLPEGAHNPSGTSIFDPVICELAYRWFSPKGGQVIDPFAGGSVRGLLAHLLGREYWGCDLRPEQIAANQEQAARITPDSSPQWVCGDALELLEQAPEADFLFSCPPYGDLERYSDDPRDLSTMEYHTFLAAYKRVILRACSRLKPDRFACFVVGDFRDPQGHYRGFVGDTVAAFQEQGLHLYNHAILVTAVGSLPIRCGKQFATGRKLGKTHQDVLVFVKGDWRKAAAACETFDRTSG